MNLNNIPHELAASNSWCVWRVEHRDNGEPTKVPYNPVTNYGARSNDPSTWVSLAVASSAMASGQWAGLGYFLNDDYVFIDLDDPYAKRLDGSAKHADPAKISAMQAEVAKRFGKTYAEISPSGTGLHIIAKGLLPSGRRRNAVEMYSNGRFMTMTGNVYLANPIVDCQNEISWLYNEMGGLAEIVTAFVGEYQDKEPDQTVIDKALNAANGVKFRDLANGNWQQYYTSQSEADFALIDILAYYTKSVFQINRIFLLSALGQRDKAQRFDGYVMPMIKRSFDNQPPPLDIDAMANALNAQFGDIGARTGTSALGKAVPQSAPPVAGVYQDAPATNDGVAFDDESDNPYRQPVPGLLGQIAYYIYDQAPRPVPEIALAGAIGLMAGICGRAFNVSGTGLNQYTMLLARTGRGKEAINSGISKLMARVTDIDGGGCPGASEFVGPSTIASGQALLKHFDRASKSFVSIMGEVDNTLKSMNSKHANAGLVMLKSIMLQSYSASGRGENLGSMVYSEKDKNTGSIQSPAFSIIGEGTPDKFYQLLDESLVSDGLLPRFTIIEYNGDRVPLNVNRAAVQPSPQLVNHLATLCAWALHLNAKNDPLNVEMTPEATAYFHQFDITVDGIMNNATNDTVNQLWNRAFLKAAKIAALVAIGINHLKPVIDLAAAEYAVKMVKRDTSRLVAKFAAGDVGEGGNKQLADMKRKIKDYYSKVDEYVAKSSYGINETAYRDRLINYTYLSNTCRNLASFKYDRIEATPAIKRTIQELIDTGMLAKVGSTSDMAKYGLNGQSVAHYIIPNLDVFLS